MSGLFKFGRALLLGLAHLWHQISFTGEENIPKQGGYIICSNHRSNFDVAYLAWRIPQQLYFMAKAELFHIPVLGFLVKHLGAFPVERGKGDTGAIDFAIDTVRDGRILAMFPEGTRSMDGKLLKAKSGAAVIAAKSGVDVLPVGLEFEEPPRFRSKIVVHYGELIHRDELKIEDNRPSDIKKATKLIMGRIASLIGQGTDEKPQ